MDNNQNNENENEFNSSSTNNSQNKINNNLNITHLYSNMNKNSKEHKIISNISDFLTDICDQKSKGLIKEKNQKIIKPFITINPSVKIKDYLEHLYKYGKMDTSTTILMIIYIDRFCNMNKIKLTYTIIHKLLLSSLITAIKYNEDSFFSLKFYSQCGGISKVELALLEFCFVTNIDFNLFVSEDLFNKYYNYFADEDSFDDDEEEEEKEIIPKG